MNEDQPPVNDDLTILADETRLNTLASITEDIRREEYILPVGTRLGEFEITVAPAPDWTPPVPPPDEPVPPRPAG